MDADRMATRAILRASLCVFLFSLVLRVGWVTFAHVTPVSDFRGYHRLAIRLLETGQFGSSVSRAYCTPGYPGFLAATYAVFGPDTKAAGLVQAVLGGLTSGMLVLLAARLLSLPVGILTGLLYSLWPTSLAYVPVLASENLAVPLMIGGLLCVVAVHRSSGVRLHVASLAAGLCYGLLLLTRPAAIFQLPAWLLLSVYNPKGRRWHPLVVLPFLCGAGLIVAPWLVRNNAVGLGPCTLSTVGGVNLWMGNNDLARTGRYCAEAQWDSKSGEKQRDDEYRRAALAWIRANPGRYLALCRTRAGMLLGTPPDEWAATWLTPSAEYDHAYLELWKQGSRNEPVDEALVSRANYVLARNTRCLGRFRFVVAPLIILGLVLSVQRWRTYAVVILPALAYLTGLALMFCSPRLRELSNPLLMVPLAALLVDMFTGASELGQRPRRGVKIALALSLVLASALVHAGNLDRNWYSLPPYRSTDADASSPPGEP